MNISKTIKYCRKNYKQSLEILKKKNKTERIHSMDKKKNIFKHNKEEKHSSRC